MIESVGIAVGFVAVAAVAFAGSVRLGILVGRRLDRALEARASVGGGDEAGASAFASSGPAQNEISGGGISREDYRGE